MKLAGTVAICSGVPWATMLSLFLFFFVVFIAATLRRVPIHPMNYFFLAAAFFSFYVLLAYLVDHISIHLAFAISSLVSVALAWLGAERHLTLSCCSPIFEIRPAGERSVVQ